MTAIRFGNYTEWVVVSIQPPTSQQHAAAFQSLRRFADEWNQQVEAQKADLTGSHRRALNQCAEELRKQRDIAPPKLREQIPDWVLKKVPADPEKIGERAVLIAGSREDVGKWTRVPPEQWAAHLQAGGKTAAGNILRMYALVRQFFARITGCEDLVGLAQEERVPVAALIPILESLPRGRAFSPDEPIPGFVRELKHIQDQPKVNTLILQIAQLADRLKQAAAKALDAFKVHYQSPVVLVGTSNPDKRTPLTFYMKITGKPDRETVRTIQRSVQAVLAKALEQPLEHIRPSDRDDATVVASKGEILGHIEVQRPRSVSASPCRTRHLYFDANGFLLPKDSDAPGATPGGSGPKRPRRRK